MRFYFKIDPEQLSNDEYCKLWNDLLFALEFDSKKWK